MSHGEHIYHPIILLRQSSNSFSQGCCVSAPSDSDSPYPATQPSSSSRAINNSQPPSATALHRPSTTHTTSSLNQTPSRQGRPLTEHFNKPLRRHIWASSDKIWTRRQLDREREAFFDTRVAGRTEVWQTLHGALEVLWSSSLANGDFEGGIATAQTILEAAGLTLPTGDLANGVYDTLGAFYSLPEWVVADPENLAEDDDEEEDKMVDGDEDEVLRRREEKGKKVVVEGDLIRVKARLSDRGGPDVVVSVGKGDSVRLLTKRVFEESDVSPSSLFLSNILLKFQLRLTQLYRQGQANATTAPCHQTHQNRIYGQDTEGERITDFARLEGRPHRQCVGFWIRYPCVLLCSALFCLLLFHVSNFASTFPSLYFETPTYVHEGGLRLKRNTAG